MASRAKAIATTDHDEIRQWAEERGARPACVRGTGAGDDVGMIRLDFPGFSGEGSLKEISWDDWFRSFDENGLALLHQQTTARGQKSNFNKLIARETAEGRQQTRRAGRGSRSRSSERRETTGSSRGRSTRARSQASTRTRRSSKNRGQASSRGPTGRSTRGSSRRGSAPTRGRRRTTNARGTAKSNAGSRSARSSSRSSRGSRTSSRRTQAGSRRTGRGNVIAMKKTARNRRTRRAA